MTATPACPSCSRVLDVEDLVTVGDRLLCQPCHEEAVKAEGRRDSIDAAWAAVEASLPKGWAITSLGRGMDEEAWGAIAEGPGSMVLGDPAPTPAKALRALVARLGEAPSR